MQRIYKGATVGIGSMLTFPSTSQNLLIAIVAVGLASMLILTLGVTYGVASGRQNVGEVVRGVRGGRMA